MADKIEKDQMIKLFAIEFRDLPVLSDIGYMFAGGDFVAPTKVLGERYKIIFMQEEHLAVEISFAPMPTEDRLGAFTVILQNFNEDDLFAIREWFLFHNRPLSYASFWLSEYEGNTEEKIRGFKKYLSGLLADPELQPVIRGARWERVPIDWAGNK